jgi:hypothetical protein
MRAKKTLATYGEVWPGLIFGIFLGDKLAEVSLSNNAVIT